MNKLIKILAITAILANFLDFATTLIGLGMSPAVYEANLLPNFLLSLSPLAFAFVKVGLVTILIMLCKNQTIFFPVHVIDRGRRLEHLEELLTIILLVLATGYFGYLGIHNLLVILGYIA